MDILTIGDVSIDQFMKIETAHVIGDVEDDDCKICFDFADKIPVTEFKASIAGNACNTAISFNNLGLTTGVYTELGDDGNAQTFIKEFETRGIDTSLVLKNENEPTDVHTVVVYEGERTIFSYHRPKDYKLDIKTKPKWIYYTSLSAGFEKFQYDLVKYLENEGDVILAFNPGTYHLKAGTTYLIDVLAITDVLFVNKEEAKKITRLETDKIMMLHRGLRDMGVKMSVITCGTHGSTSFDGSEMFTLGLPKLEIETIDKTGAGDSYASGFTSALFHGKDIQTAMKWGALNSAGVVTKIGAIHGLSTKEDIENKLQNGIEFTEFIDL